MTSTKRARLGAPRTLDDIASRAAAIGFSRQRRLLAAIAVLCTLLAFGSVRLHMAAASHQLIQGAEEGNAAAAATRRAQAFWTPDRGYGGMSGRAFAGEASWGAGTLFEPMPGDIGLSINYAYATREQCAGLVRSASVFFDHIFIDGSPAPKEAPERSCSTLGQNAVRLVTFESRARSTSAMASDATAHSPLQGLAPTSEQLRWAREGRSAAGATPPPFLSSAPGKIELAKP